LLKFALKESKKRGISLLIENEPICTIYKKQQIKDIAKKFKKENLKIWFDFANFYSIGENIWYKDIKELANDIKYFHIKDFDSKINKYVSLGEGSINYKRIFTDLKDIFSKKEIFISLEVHVKDNRKEAVLKSLLNLNKLIKLRRISYGIIGCGNIFKKHAEAIQNDENSELRSIFDTNRKRKETTALIYDCEAESNSQNIFKNPKVKVINICTPHDTHKDLILKTIYAGKYCLCEKPLCLSKKEGEEIINNRYYKNNVFVVFQNRFNPAIQFLFQLIRSKTLGKIRLCSVTVRWYRDDNYFKDEWHYNIKKVGGMLFNQGIHSLDLMLKICGEPKKIQKIIKILRNFTRLEDICTANIVFKNGIIGNIEITTYTKHKDFEASIFIIGDKGSIKIGGPGLNRVEYLNVRENLKGKKDLYSEVINDKYGNSHQKLITAFSKYLLKNKYNVNLVSAKESKKLVEFIEKIYKK